MQHVTVSFENPISNMMDNLDSRCHSLSSDSDKFIIAKVNENNEVEFLGKNKKFKPTQELTQNMFDNRFELFPDIYTAELALNKLITCHPNQPTPYYLYQVATPNRTNDTLSLKIIKKI